MNSTITSFLKINANGETELEKLNLEFNNKLLETDKLIFDSYFPIWSYYILKDYLLTARTARPKTQTRGDNNASNRKMRPQKHTGFARMGARSSASRVGGIKAFGPNGRNHAKKTNRVFFKKFIINAIWKKINENKIIIVDSEIVKTKVGEMALENLQTNFLNSENKNIYLLGEIVAMQNLENIKNISFNTILKPLCYNHSMIITYEEWEKLSNRFNIVSTK